MFTCFVFVLLVHVRYDAIVLLDVCYSVCCVDCAVGFNRILRVSCIQARAARGTCKGEYWVTILMTIYVVLVLVVLVWCEVCR